MKKINFLLIMAVIVMAFSSCNNQSQQVPQSNYDINVNSDIKPSDGLDLKLVASLIQGNACKSAEDFEKEINKSGGINNLDLNGDGAVDYINVSENDPKGSKAERSFDLTTGKGDSLTHIATINIQKQNDNYVVNMSGNKQVYGNNCNYQSSYSSGMGDMLFLYWMFAPRPLFYHPYYYYGYYPRYYGSGYMMPRVVSNASYNSRTTVQRQTVTKTVKTTSAPSASSIKSSNQGKTSFSNNSVSQKQFNTRNTNNSVSKGGFGNSSNSYSKPSTSSSSYSKPSSSSGSFGSSSSKSFGGSSSGSYSRRCDSTFKYNIQTLNYTNEALKLKPVSFYYKDKKYGEGKNLGFLAQDVKEVIPEAVFKDKKGYLIDYAQIIPVLVKTIQNQELRIKELERKVNSK